MNVLRLDVYTSIHSSAQLLCVPGGEPRKTPVLLVGRGQGKCWHHGLCQKGVGVGGLAYRRRITKHKHG
jgi:hypothetical protein